MEWKTFLDYRAKLQYKGVARTGWVGDYMDPYTFLYLFYSPQNAGATGWWDAKFDQMLDDANNTLDPQERYLYPLAHNRPDGSTYHITWSLGPGREARESNDVLRDQGWDHLSAPIDVTLEPARF